MPVNCAEVGMSLILAFAAASFTVRADKISFETGARPASAVIHELGEKLGQPLGVSNALAAEPLVISVKDVEPQALLKEIADAAHASWERDGETMWLKRPPAVEKQLVNHEIAAEALLLKAAIAKLLKSPTLSGGFTAADAQKLATDTERLMNPADNTIRETPAVTGLMSRSPGFRALVRLLAKLDPADLAGALRHKRAVFATNPTRMQLPLPGGADSILNDFLNEQALFVKATEEYWQQNVRPASRFGIWGVSRGEWMKGNPKLGLGKGMLRLFRIGTNVGASLSIADTNGNALVEADAQLEEAPMTPTPIAVPRNEPTLKPSPVGIEIAGIVTRPLSETGYMEMAASGPKGEKRLRIPAATASPMKAISPQLAEFLLRPEVHEPMSLGASEALLAYAHETQANVVADLDDRCWSDVQKSITASATAGSILNSPAFQARNSIALQAGWLIVSPCEPVLATLDRTNRAGLGNLLRTLDRQKFLNLDQIAQFALSQEKPASEGELELVYMRLINAGAANRAYDPENWLMYRLYGSMAPSQRQELFAGRPVRWMNLSPAAKDNLTKLVFEGGATADVVLPGGKKMNSWEEPILADWTQLLPDGLLDIEITAKSTLEPAVFAVNSKTGASEFASVSTLAGFAYVRETPSLNKYSANLPAYDRFTAASVSKLAFHFATSPNVSFSKELSDGATDPGAPATDVMPADFNAKVNAELASLRAAFGQGDNGSGTPPPQR